MREFPDQSHINRVRDALWQRSAGGASLMVGAGFSRNAENASLGGHVSPTWLDLANAMRIKLYPQNSNGHQPPATGPGNFLRLAQEYETAFGRADLHKFLRQHIQDDALKPKDMHTRLMRLPWRDIFTTNWDTLLEKTRPTVLEHNYSVLRNMHEISLTCRPRIVKLHGSLPSQFPLIFTEEDYRTYPAKFAPFVNTVQQAMMETALLLIGFSGDDPNFLHWSGWVRDNLGRSAPKIYLAGWLDLPGHSRRMLEDRNIVPIDLSRHPKSGSWPDPHKYATNWLLHALEFGRPYNVSNWPSPPKHHVSGDLRLLEPLEKVNFKVPKEEISTPSVEEKSMDPSTSTQELLDVWRHNRKAYPGWLVVPSEKQSRLGEYTRIWESQILDSLPNLNPVDRLNAIHELIWRLEILADPISDKLETAADEALTEHKREDRSNNGLVDVQPNWEQVREAWSFVALALVTVARQRFDRGAFDRRVALLSGFQDYDHNIANQIFHQRCLWAINSLEYMNLESLLNEWRVEDCDPVWMMRKSALLCEVALYKEAEKLLSAALTAIRQSSESDWGVAGPSRESWALYSALNIEDFFQESSSLRRLEQLTPLKCNALAEMHRYTEAIEGKGRDTKKAPFDLDEVQVRSFSRSTGYFQWIAARRAVRLTEIAGLPSKSGSNMGMTSEALGLAAVELSRHEPEFAVRLILRVASYYGDKNLEAAISRTRVALMLKDSAVKIVRFCLDAVEYILLKAFDLSESDDSFFWGERLGVVIEVISRLIVRCDPEMVEHTFCKALDWYGDKKIAQDHRLERPVQHILKRSWEAMPEQLKRRHILGILNAPIVGMDGFYASRENRYPEPAYLLTKDLVPYDGITNNGHWRNIVNLLVRGLRTDGEARKRASIRISWVDSHGLLNDAERSLVGQSLWGDDYEGHDNLPSGTRFFDWVFLLLPEPMLGISERRFRKRWLSEERSPGEGSKGLDDVLWHVGTALCNLKIHENPLALSNREREHVAECVARWSEARVPFPLHVSGVQEFMYREKKHSTRRAVDGLQHILVDVKVSESVARRLHKKFYKLNESNFPAFGSAVGLIKSVPQLFDEVVLRLRMEISSENKILASDAMDGLALWLRVAAEPEAKIILPPDDLVREIGLIVATRKRTVLGEALQIAKWIFSDGSSKHRDLIGELVSQGLGYLAGTLRYDTSQELSDDIPLLRWRCVHLALAMASRGFENDSAVANWVQGAENDPLPEVRYARRPPDGGPDDTLLNINPVLDPPK